MRPRRSAATRPLSELFTRSTVLKLANVLTKLPLKLHLFHTIIINKGGQVTKPIIVVKICYKLLYVIQVVKKILLSNFLASTDIKVFGRTYLFAMLLLIGIALFLHPISVVA